MPATWTLLVLTVGRLVVDDDDQRTTDLFALGAVSGLFVARDEFPCRGVGRDHVGGVDRTRPAREADVQ